MPIYLVVKGKEHDVWKHLDNTNFLPLKSVNSLFKGFLVAIFQPRGDFFCEATGKRNQRF
jgi:hypothetical protein